jgi:hypothetical protein
MQYVVTADFTQAYYSGHRKLSAAKKAAASLRKKWGRVHADAMPRVRDGSGDIVFTAQNTL